MKRIALILQMIAMTYGLPQGADTEGGGGKPYIISDRVRVYVCLYKRSR